MAPTGVANQSCVQDRILRAARVLGVDPAADRAAVRAAFRAALRRERPDLGAMPAERLARLMAARDVLLAAAPASSRPPSGPAAASRAGPAAAPAAGAGPAAAPSAGPRPSATASRPSGPLAGRFHEAAPTRGRLVDVYA